jgi:hypothetical protein
MIDNLVIAPSSREWRTMTIKDFCIASCSISYDYLIEGLDLVFSKKGLPRISELLGKEE